MSLNKTDKNFKTLINKRFTTDPDDGGRKFYSEDGADTLNIHSREVWTDDVPNDPLQATGSGVAIYHEQMFLTPDPTFPSAAQFAMSGSGFIPGENSYDKDYQLTNFISDKYSASYEIQLYDSGGNQIFKTDAINWIFDYKTGILHIADPGNYDLPYRISAYRYIGNTLNSGSSFTDITSSFITASRIECTEITCSGTITGSNYTGSNILCNELEVAGPLHHQGKLNFYFNDNIGLSPSSASERIYIMPSTSSQGMIKSTITYISGSSILPGANSSSLNYFETKDRFLLANDTISQYNIEQLSAGNVSTNTTYSLSAVGAGDELQISFTNGYSNDQFGRYSIYTEFLLDESSAKINIDWNQLMIESYESLHGRLESDVKTELKDRMVSGSYLYSTFGPPGQNKQICDFVMAFKFTGSLSTKTNSKTGDTLRWDADGTIYNQNNFPTHTLGVGDGILSVSSTDGWSGIIDFDFSSQELRGIFPALSKLRFNNIEDFYLYNTDLTIDLQNLSGMNTMKQSNFQYMQNMSGDIGRFFNDKTNLTTCDFDHTTNVIGDIGSIGSASDIILIAAESASGIGGTIDPWISCSNLLYVTCDYLSNVSGNIDTAIRDNTNIVWFRMNDSKISGSFSSFNNKSNIDHLYISRTGVTGNFDDALVSKSGFRVIYATSCDISGSLGIFKSCPSTQTIGVGATKITGSIEDLPDWLYQVYVNSTDIAGDIGKYTIGSNLYRLVANNTSISTCSGRFASKDLYALNLSNLNWTSQSIDMVLHDYKLISDSPGLIMTTQYTIDLGGNNAPPSTAGLASRSALIGLGWSGSGGITIPTGSG